MFQQRRQAALGNINLGTLSQAPTFQDITFLQEQASRYRGRFVEISWSIPKSGAAFQLTAKFVPHQAQPTWMLYRGGGASSELIWGHTSNDLTLMHNLVMLECEKKAEDGDNISAASYEHLMTTNRHSGSVAGLQEEPKAALPAAAPGHDSREQAKPAPASVNPTQTWLNNVTQQSLAKLSAGSFQAAPSQPPGDLFGTAGGASPGLAAPGDASAVEGATAHDISLYCGGSGGNLLDGSLSNISTPKLLNYLALNRLTGRLALQSATGAAEVFLKDGVICHAATLDYQGEYGLLDAATWTEGEFNFHAGDQTGQHTLKMASSDIVLACQRMLEFSSFLRQAQVRSGSYFKKSAELSRIKFDQTLKETAAANLNQLWRFYEATDGNRCLSDLLRVCPMSRPEWIPALYALLSSGVLTILDQPVDARPSMFLEGSPLDENQVNAFLLSLCDQEDAVLKQDAFMYFLQQEHFRHERTGAQYALALFNIATSNRLDGSIAPLSKSMMKEAAASINKTKRKLDLVGHFDRDEYALLLPETDSAGAAVFANRVAHLLKKLHPVPDAQSSVLVVSFGIASVPQDVRDLSALLAAARVAKARSKMLGAPVCLYADN